jgi:hypothetical protein
MQCGTRGSFAIEGDAHGQLPADFSDRRLQRNDDRGADEHDRYQNKHGEGQGRDQVASDHSVVSEMREHVRIEREVTSNRIPARPQGLATLPRRRDRKCFSHSSK